MSKQLKKGLRKWFICCAALIILFLIFGDIGILFAVGFDYVILLYM